MSDFVKRVVNAPTFANGILYPAGAEVMLPKKIFDDERKPDDLGPGDPGNMSNLEPKGTKPTANGPVSTIGSDITGMSETEREEVDDLRAQVAEMRRMIQAMSGDKGSGAVEEEPATPAIKTLENEPSSDGMGVGGQAEGPLGKTNLDGNVEDAPAGDPPVVGDLPTSKK